LLEGLALFFEPAGEFRLVSSIERLDLRST
jgi:hypothetical protein